MRSDSSVDQADGLRRMLASKQTRVIAVVAGKPGVGRTSVTINLAAALAHSGNDVLVLDENPAPNNLLDQLGMPVRFDLLDVAQAKCKLNDAILPGKGYTVLSAARAMRALPKLASIEQRRLEQALAELNTAVDVMLVDTAMPALSLSQHQGLPARGVVSSSLATGTSMLVVADATASGITASYTLIKHMALENARLQFDIIVNKAGSDQEAKNVFDNMAKVARHHLSARLKYLGHIPADNKLQRATQLGRSVVEAFPGACSAQACLTLAQKILCQPASLEEHAGGISNMMQSLFRQADYCRVNAAVSTLTM